MGYVCLRDRLFPRAYVERKCRREVINGRDVLYRKERDRYEDVFAYEIFCSVIFSFIYSHRQHSTKLLYI